MVKKDGVQGVLHSARKQFNLNHCFGNLNVNDATIRCASSVAALM